MKNCTNSDCSKINPQPLDQFHKHSSTPDGLQYRCKDCGIEASKNWQKMNVEKHRSTQRKYQERWRKNNPEKNKLKQRTVKYRFYRGRSNAKTKGLDWNISFQDYVYLVTKNCHYCAGFFPKVETCAGLDRIDNKNGYTLDNVLPACTFCNLIRGDRLTVKETEVVIRTIIGMRMRTKFEPK